MFQALEGVKIKDVDSDERIKEALRYGLILMGISEVKYGDELSKQVLINYLKNTFPNIRLEEMKLAFDFAIEKRTIANTVLYQNEFVSAKFISDIITAFIDLKKKEKVSVLAISTPKITPMNNMDRGLAILSLIKEKSPETYEKLQGIGKTEKKQLDLPPLPYHDIHQKWLRQFDKLKVKFEYVTETYKHTGLLMRYGGFLTVEDFFRIKADQLNIVNEFLKENSRRLICFRS